MPDRTKRPDMVSRNQEVAHRLAAVVAEQPGASPTAVAQAAGLFALSAAISDISAAIRGTLAYAKEEDRRDAAAQKAAA